VPGPWVWVVNGLEAGKFLTTVPELDVLGTDDTFALHAAAAQDVR
jgi:hypothetical protein